jgi:hypothetical protein
LEAVDEDTGRPEAGQLYDRRATELDERPERHPLEVQASSGDVLAELSGAHVEAGFSESYEQLAGNEVDLSEIGKPGLAAGETAVPDECAGVGIAFNTMAFHQHDPILRRFAEVVTAIGGDRDHVALERERVRLRH